MPPQLANDTQSQQAHAAHPEPVERGPWLGEVVDTHHPQRVGRVLTRWSGQDGAIQEQWLVCTSGSVARVGDRVLLVRPVNATEHVVSAVLSPSRPHRTPAPNAASSDGSKLVLQPEQTLSVAGPDGHPLLELSLSPRGPVLRWLDQDLGLSIPGCFRIDADRVEVMSGEGGTDLRSEGEIVLRSPRIRLN